MNDPFPITVVGYPRSGNTWLARMLGQALGAPVKSQPPRQSFADEGLDRESPLVIRQEHRRYDEDFPGAVVLITRDPRDVAVSLLYFVNGNAATKTISGALGYMRMTFGGWDQLTLGWMHHPLQVIGSTTFERLRASPEQELTRIVNRISYKLTHYGIVRLPAIDAERIAQIVSDQSLDAVKARIRSGEQPSVFYPAETQLHHLRHGVAGEWRSHFTPDDAHLCQKFFGDAMVELGYVESADWVDEFTEQYNAGKGQRDQGHQDS